MYVNLKSSAFEKEQGGWLIWGVFVPKRNTKSYMKTSGTRGSFALHPLLFSSRLYFIFFRCFSSSSAVSDPSSDSDFLFF